MAGTPHDGGYRKIVLYSRKYFAHRLAWIYVYGVAPDKIDHIDGDRDNNRIANLRACTNSQNSANSRIRSDNSSGLKGVSWDCTKKKWVAQIRCHGKSFHLGRFKSKIDASVAYSSAAVRFFGKFARAVAAE